MKKKRLIILFSFLIPIFILTGLALWIITTDHVITPAYDENHSLAKYFVEETNVTYDGEKQSPDFKENIYTNDSDKENFLNTVSFYYKNYGEVGKYSNGLPIDAGNYSIKILKVFYDNDDTDNQEGALYVKLNIAKANPTLSGSVVVSYTNQTDGTNRSDYFVTSQDVDDITYSATFIGVNNETLTGTIKYSDTTYTSLQVGTNSYSYTFTPESSNYNTYTGNCSITTYATVSFHNEGSQYGNTIYVPYGELIDEPSSPSKTGYDFNGWYYNSSKWIFSNGVTCDMNLDANYVAKQYTIAYFDSDDSTLNTSNPTSYTIEDEFTLQEPTKDGYVFLGWTGTDLTEKTTTVKISKGSTGDRTYTAHWKIGIKIDVLEIDYSSIKQWSAFQTDIVNAISTYLTTNYSTISLSYPTDYTINSMTDDNYIEESTSSGKIYNSSTPTKYVNGSTYVVEISIKNEEYSLYDQVSKTYLETANVLLKYKTVSIGSTDSTLYTIEDAIENAGTSTIITAGANTVVTNGVTTSTFIRTNFSALDKSTTGYTDVNYNLKTKLRVPFADVDMDLHGSDGRVNSSADGGFETIEVTSIDEVYSLLYIPYNVTLVLNSGSNLVSAGLLGSSGTTKNRGVIINEGTIEGNSGSSIYSYGYIKGTGIINLNSGSKLTDVCKMFDWMGGGKSAGLNNANIFPINAFSVHNNACSTKIFSGSNYEAFWNIEFDNTLYTGFQRGDENGNISIVGSNGLFNLENGYIIKGADEGIKNSEKTYLSTYSGSNQVIGQRDTVRIFGTCSDNSVSIKIDAGLTNFTMTTNTTMAVPIAYMKISTEKDDSGNTGNLTLDASSYKFLPGSSLTIYKDTSITVKSGVNLLFYDIASCISDEAKRGTAFITASGGKCVDRYDSYIEVNGDLNVNSGAYIGGKILTSSEGAVSLIKGSATCSVLYVTSYKEGLITDTYGTSARTYNAKMYMYDGSTIQSSLSTIATGSYYSIKASDKYGWYSDKLRFYYDLNGGTSSAIDVSSEKDVGSSGYTIKSSDITTTIPTRDYYEFDDWYIDKACTTKAVGTTIYSSVYLYAGWTPIDYDITYEYIYNSCTTSGTITNTNPSQYNNTSNITLSTPIDGTLVFGGWYSDEEYTEEITQIYNGFDDLTIYGLWYPAGTETYLVEYNIVNSSSYEGEDLIVIKDSSSIVSINTSWKPDDLGVGINEKSSKEYYFDGWYIDENYTTKFSSITGNCTLYGRWLDKNKITLMYSGVEYDKYFYIPGTTINLDSGNSTLNETMIWFANEECTTTDYYIGGENYSSTSLDSNIILWGEYYYVITNDMYKESSYNIGNSSNILFNNVDFTYKTSEMSASVKCDLNFLGSWSCTPTKTKQSINTAVASKMKQVIFENCTFVQVTNNKTYATGSDSNSWGTTKYAIIYNGLFDSCTLLEQVIVSKTTLTSQTFSNCNSTLKIYTNDGIISDISKYIPSDQTSGLSSAPIVIQ